MGVFIKVSENKVLLAGTVANQQMLDEGYFEHEGEIPQGPSEFLVYNTEEKTLSIDEEALKSKISENLAASNTKLAELHKDFVEKLLGTNTPNEVATWEFKFRLANDISANNKLTEEQDIYFTYLKLKTKKDRTAWSTKVLGKSLRTRAVQGVADYIRSDIKDKLEAVTTVDGFYAIVDEAIVAFDEMFDKLNNLV